jgi:pimeloyl-ACP methyl ester carboxylesterase
MAAADLKNKATRRAVVFFIGGAGDTRSFLGFGPNNNVAAALRAFYTRAISMPNIARHLRGAIAYHYLGYNEVFGASNIQNKIIAKLQSKEDLIYIVGHSLGGWNGAYLTKLLGIRGYRTTMLITLDPVGTRVALGAFADIYFACPEVHAKYWINIRATPPRNMDSSDVVAKLGGQWTVRAGPQINKLVAINHLDAAGMFTNIIQAEGSALDIMLASLAKYFSSQS